MNNSCYNSNNNNNNKIPAYLRQNREFKCFFKLKNFYSVQCFTTSNSQDSNTYT